LLRQVVGLGPVAAGGAQERADGLLMPFHEPRKGLSRPALSGRDQGLIEARQDHRPRNVVLKIAAIRLPMATMVMMMATRWNGPSVPGQSDHSEAHQNPAATAPVTKAERHCQ